MKIKVMFTIVLLTALFSACKRDRLEGDDLKYAGTWRWIGTTGGLFGGGDVREAGYNRKLEIFKKGKYKISSDNKKLGHGILTKDGEYYKFLNRELRGSDELHEEKIVEYFGDTIFIATALCCDQVFEIYVKEK
jgi:hypothetical protein